MQTGTFLQYLLSRNEKLYEDLKKIEKLKTV